MCADVFTTTKSDFQIQAVEFHYNINNDDIQQRGNHKCLLPLNNVRLTNYVQVFDSHGWWYC